MVDNIIIQKKKMETQEKDYGLQFHLIFTILIM
jgi:hypothetical protein